MYVTYINTYVSTLYVTYINTYIIIFTLIFQVLILADVLTWETGLNLVPYNIRNRFLEVKYSMKGMRRKQIVC